MKFPEYFDTNNIENKILKIFNASIQTHEKDSIFEIDISRTKWIDLFGLSILLHMISKSLEVTNKVEIFFPATYTLEDDLQKTTINSIEFEPYYKKRKEVCAFLDRWGFLKYINEMPNIKTDFNKQNYDIWSKANEAIISHVLELKFISSYEDLTAIKNLLNDESKIVEMFESYSSLNVFESGKFANILIWELGKNIIDHSQAKIGLLTIHIVNDFWEDEKRNVRNKNRLNFSVEWEKQYFANNSNNGYIEIILSDNGVGVYNSLKYNYSQTLKVPLSNINEADVLEWSFLEYSSKNEKNPEEEARTGLYWVINCVESAKGFISLRVGNSIVAYNYSGKQSSYEPYKNSNLEYVQGTHIKIMIPLKDDLENQFISRPTYYRIKDIKGLGKSKSKNYIVYNSEHEVENSDYNKIIKEIDEYRIGLIPYENNLLIDSKYLQLDKNSLNKLFMKLYSIGNSTSIVIYNFDHKLISVLITTKAFELITESHSLIPILLNNNNVYWLGLNPTQNKISTILQYIFNNKSVDETELNRVIDYNDELRNEFRSITKTNAHIVRIKKPFDNESYELSFSNDSINFYMDQSSQIRLEKYLLETKAIQKGKYFFPAGNYYSETFIEARRLIEEPYVEKHIIHELKRQITVNHINYDIILSCTPTGRGLAALLYESTGGSDYSYFKSYFFNDTDIPSKRISKGDKILILTDVIGIGNLLERLVRYVKISQAKPIAILSIINTGNKLNSISDVPIYSLLNFTIDKIFTKPISWNNSDIQIINPDTTSPEPVKEIINESIQAKDSKNYHTFWKLVQESESLIGEHVTIRDRCYQYYINTKMIFSDKNRRNYIVNELTNSIDCKNIDIIFYPLESNITELSDTVISHISQLTKNKLKAIPAFRNEDSLFNDKYYLSSTYKNDFQKKNIIIIDDCTNTARTLEDLIEICEDFEVNSVIIYVFINRLHPNRFIEFKRRIDDSKVKITFEYFYYLDLTVHNKKQCPYCEDLEIIKLDKNRFKSSFAAKQIKQIVTLNSHSNDKLTKYSEQTFLSAKIKEQVNSLGIKKSIKLLHDEREPLKIQSFFDALCENEIYIHPQIDDQLFDKLCEDILSDKINFHIKSKILAIKYLEKKDDGKLVGIFRHILFNLSKNELLYYYMLNVYSKMLLSHEDLKINFEKALSEIQKEIKTPSSQPQIFTTNNFRLVRRYIHYFMQDFVEIIQINEEDHFYNHLIKVFKLMRPLKNSHHSSLYHSLNLLQLLLFRIMEPVGGNNTKYVQHLIEKAKAFSDLYEDLIIILFVSDIIHDLKDIKVSNYFLQTHTPNMRDDIYMLEAGMTEVISNNKHDNLSSECLNYLRIPVDRLLLELFNQENSLKNNITEYYVALNKILDDILLQNEKQLNAYNIKTKIQFDVNKVYRVLYDKKNLTLLFSNLIDDSITHGFKNKTINLENEIVLNIRTSDDKLHLEYSDNGLGDYNNSFLNSFNSNDKTWGEYRKLFSRYGVKIHDSVNNGYGFKIKLEFIGGEYEK